MKFLISAVMLFACANVFAAPTAPAKSKIRLVKKDAMRMFATNYEFFGPVAVGRISPTSYQVELIGMTVPDMWPPTPAPAKARMVKAVLDISPLSSDPGDVQAADDLLSFFYMTKAGKNDEDGSSLAKLVSVAYEFTGIDRFDPASTSVCLGFDLETPMLASAPLLNKTCYTLRPTHVIQH